MRKYLNVIVIAALLTTTLYAAQITKKIDVVFNAITIMVNGEEVKADNIVHQGTTYVPLRAISELLDKEVTWTAETKTAYINDDNNIKQQHPVALMTMENGDQVKIELYPEVAPITVKNFLTLIDQGFYDGLTFHRLIPGFMAQGGDPEGNGTGGASNKIKGEFRKNGIPNDILHTRGTLSMARSVDPDSASSQFFIVVEDSGSLDGQYAGFGKVIDGMDTVDKIVNVGTDADDKPLTPQIIKNIKVIK
ncbi:MAG TPA: peptidylprolyl isomerase [Epulopiscium sp.]|nr:peptidylprolyl isomerase [Candidatus Epulonipiscium sp.]